MKDRESYGFVLNEIHNRVAGYLKEMYGDIGDCTLADDQDHVYGQCC
ncbi:hypothetical protein ACIQZI_22345 [Peribacillus sp. NPDC096379]